MKKLLLSIALLASCASVMAITPKITSRSGNVQVFDATPQEARGESSQRNASSHSNRDPNKPIDFSTTGGAKVKLYEPTNVRTTAQPMG